MPATRRLYDLPDGRRLTRNEIAEQILARRDLGETLQACADHFGLPTRQAARALWIHGLRRAGREAEVNVRSLAVRLANGTTVVIDSNDLADTFTFGDLDRGWTTFGAEIECYALGFSGCETSLRRAGLQAEQEGYNHNTRGWWKITSDSSISGARGAEVVSPVLRGDDGLREMRTAMTALRESGARVNASCGGHIHIGTSTWLTEEEEARVIERWWLVEQALEMLILPSRRNTRWGKRWTKSEAVSFGRAWRNGDRSGQYDRYKSLNLQAYGRQGTFEVRMHNGSLNGKNHAAWVILNQAVLYLLATASQETMEHLVACAVEAETEQVGAEVIAFSNDTLGDHMRQQVGYSADGTQRVVGVAWGDGHRERLLKELVGLLVRRGLISSAVASHVGGRVEWIKNRNNRGDSSRGV